MSRVPDQLDDLAGLRRAICELWEQSPQRLNTPNGTGFMLRFYFDLTSSKPDLLSQLPCEKSDESWDLIRNWLESYEGTRGR